jgi:hypothetical protein
MDNSLETPGRRELASSLHEFDRFATGNGGTISREIPRQQTAMRVIWAYWFAHGMIAPAHL